MAMLLHAKCLQRLAIAGPLRVLYKDYRTATPQNFSNYESMKQDFKLEIPEHFNFAKDVLDQWSSVEKTVFCRHASDNHTCVNTRHNEMMAIYFTSGTTGHPKMIGHTHSSFGLGLSVNGRFWLDLTDSDVMWNTSDTDQTFHVRQFALSKLQTLSKFPITVFCSAPTAYRMLVQNDTIRSYKFKSLKHCVSAGEPINPEVMEQWRRKTGLDIYEGYGQTETILDENGAILPPGQEGDIGVQVLPERPFGLFTHYVDNPSKTASTIRGNFYITGDRGYMDEDGYFWFVARSDDVILSSGYRIGPFEVESALIEHPSISESAVVSSPDPVRGEVEFIEELPKTVSGKVKRNELRKKEWKTI
ncbi:hypothetical protein ACRRTK_010859 [Alexandromys fortis]